MSPRISLVAALVLPLAWAGLTFVVPPATGLIHALLAAGVLLLVRWLALRDAATP